MEDGFSREWRVFGVRILATSSVPEEKLRHAATVLAEYLDNDENGTADDPRVIEALRSGGATLLLFGDDREAERYPFNTLPPAVYQDLHASEIHPGGAARGVFDVTLEEVLHLVSHGGYARVHPRIFGEERESALTHAMDRARGGHFERVPAVYPAGAWYTYDDRTCDYPCQVTEYFYWALTSLLGGQDFPGRGEEIAEEWRLNTPEKLKQGDPAVYALLTDPRYRLPKNLPDGRYSWPDRIERLR